VFNDKAKRPHVAWDIETTGFGWDDTITTAGFWWPAGRADLLLNAAADGADADRHERRLRDAAGVPVGVTVVDGEAALLRAMARLVFDRFDRDRNRLVAFNADSWQGGFDLPFVRTRCVVHGVDWVFDGAQFADLWDPLKKRVNTTHTVHDASVAVNSLSGAHAVLFSWPEAAEAVFERADDDHPWYHGLDYDPFDDSGEAVAAHRRGDHLPVLLHNLADVHRTWELGEVVREFVPGKDVTTKKL
jgi:hypothetical protein